MLDTLSLIEKRNLPTLPAPKPVIKQKMLALAALIDVPVDLWPDRSGILPTGCWWLPQADLALYGTACRRPLMFNEVSDISRATGLKGIILRYSDMADDRCRISFDVHNEGAWHARHLLWLGAGGNTPWLLSDLGGGGYIRLSQWGVDVTGESPFLDEKDRQEGFRRGADYLAHFNGAR